MEGTLKEWMEAGEPLMERAVEALRSYHDAKAAGEPPDEVNRLRWEAEKLFKELNDFQLRAFGGASSSLH